VTDRTDVRAALHAAVDAALDAAEAEFRADHVATTIGVDRSGAIAPTSLQAAQARLLELVHDVIGEYDEREARAFFSFLINVAARNGRRAGSGWSL
jgi:hypothetical protein